MTVKLQNSKTMLLWDESYNLAASQDFSDRIGMACVFSSSVTSGEATVTSPSGTTGVRIAGILKINNAKYASDSSNVRAVVCKLGMCAGRALGAISAGVELMVGDSYGRLTTATGSGKYVVAIAREAAIEADDMIAIEVVSQYPLT
jgi:hypothetical protein